MSNKLIKLLDQFDKRSVIHLKYVYHIFALIKGKVKFDMDGALLNYSSAQNPISPPEDL